MIRRTLIICGRFCASIFLMLALIIILACTQRGSYLLLKVSSHLVPGQMAFEKFSGRLINNFSFDSFNFRSEGLNLDTKHVHVIWSIWDLFHKKFKLDNFYGENINIYISDSSSQPKNNKKLNFSWLNFLDLKHIELNNLNIFKNQQPQVVIQQFNFRENIHNQFNFLLISNKGEVKGVANIAHSITQLQWQIQARIKDLNLQSFNESIKSNINFDIRSAGTWDGNLQKMNFNLQNLSGKFQDNPVTGYSDFYYDQKQIEIKKSQIKVGATSFELTGTIRDQWNINWRLQVPNLQTLFPDSRGIIFSTGKVFGIRNRPKIVAEVRIENFKLFNVGFALLQGNLNTKFIPSVKLILNLTGTKFNIDNYLIPKISLTSESHYQQNDLATNFSLIADKDNTVNGTIDLPNYSSLSDLSQLIKSKIDFNFALEKLFTSLPDVKDLRGKLAGYVNVSGKIRDPKITSNLKISDGNIFINPLKTNFSDINASGYLDYPNPLQFSGHFKANKGEGEITGTADLFAANYPIDLNIKGKDLQLANLNEYKINISPDVQIKIDNEHLILNGNIFVPYAKITPKDFSETVTLPAEVVFVDQEKTETTNLPANLTLNVKIKLGEQINLQYQNLKTRLIGELEIHQLPNSPPKATGTLNTVEGSYNAYSNELKIQNGRIIYTGNELANPGLDIRAIKEIEAPDISGKSQFDNNGVSKSVYTGNKKITVGVWVKGTAAQPNINFFSKPGGLSQTDILSYLIFGYPQSEINNASGLALLNSVATEMNLGGATSSTDKIKKTLGLSELGVTSVDVYDEEKNSTKKETMVNMGKKIGRKLYLRYRVGVFNSTQILNLKYQISKRLAIQSETNGKDNGADILFEYERD